MKCTFADRLRIMGELNVQVSTLALSFISYWGHIWLQYIAYTKNVNFVCTVYHFIFKGAHTEKYFKTIKDKKLTLSNSDIAIKHEYRQHVFIDSVFPAVHFVADARSLIFIYIPLGASLQHPPRTLQYTELKPSTKHIVLYCPTLSDIFLCTVYYLLKCNQTKCYSLLYH